MIKVSRIAGTGVVLRRHPRLAEATGPGNDLNSPEPEKSQTLKAGITKDADTVVPLPAAFVPADTDAAFREISEAPIEERCAQHYANGLEEGQRSGHEAGHADGVQEGLRQAESAARIHAAALDKLGIAIVEACTEACTQGQAAIEAGAIEIAYAALLQLLGERAGDRLVVADAVRLVLAQLRERTPMSIRLSPADHALLAEEAHGLEIGDARLVADERVVLGGCIVDTDAGSLDGRLETRLAELASMLLDLHRTRGPDEAQP